MITQSNQFFINMKSIPTEDSSEYDEFFQEEKKKIEYGVTINGVYIHGWLYFHLNHWNIYVDIEDQINHTIKRKFQRPLGRDNEWIIAEHLKGAEEDRTGLLIFGSRRLGKSEFEASYIARHTIINQGSENVITGGNWSDIDIITNKVDKGLNAIHPYFQLHKISQNWRNEVSFGMRDRKNNKYEYSKILIRNFDNGANTEAVAGITASSFLLDEGGKFNWLECFDAAKPAFTSPYGWRVVPIVTGTSGLLKPDTDAQKVFENPEAYNFRAVELKDEGKKTAIFIPGTRRMEAKFETTFGDFIESENGILIPKESELFTIPFLNSDLQKGSDIIEEEIRVASLSPDPAAALKARMYYPRNTNDLFLSDDNDNPFPVEALKQHLEFIKRVQDKKYIRLYRDVTNKVCWVEDSKLKPINEFPVSKDTDKRAPIIIYELPITGNIPNWLYIAGGDPYNTDKSINSPSLGTITIYKRTYDPVAGTYQNRIVATYAARPDTMKEWHENVEMLLEFYNATLMIENAGTNFIQYMDSKNKGHFLADGYNLAKEIQPNSSIQGKLKGLPPTSKIQNHYKNCIVNYCMEELILGTNAETGELIKGLGLSRIPDEMLIVELINWKPNKPGKKHNSDRYVAFGHVLVYDEYLGKIAPNVKFKEETEDIKKTPTPPRSPFIIGNKNSNSFGAATSRNAFGL